MERRLLENFEFIQGKIDKIKTYTNLDVKAILDLKSYVEIQKHIVSSIARLRECDK